jgi:hypothetical protein
MTGKGPRSRGRGELEPLADLIDQLGSAGRFTGEATGLGSDPVIGSPHRLGKASCTVQLLVGAAGAAIWEARGGTRTDISMDIIHGLHYMHLTHYVEQSGYPSNVGAEFVDCGNNKQSFAREVARWNAEDLGRRAMILCAGNRWCAGGPARDVAGQAEGMS